MKTRRILFHLEGVGIGGNETMLASLLPRLRDRGWRSWLVIRLGRAADFLKPYCEGILPVPGNPPSWAELLDEARPDVVVGIHGDIFSLARAARARAIPSVWMFGHPLSGMDHARHYRAVGATLFDQIIAQSEFLARDLGATSNVSVISNGVDADRFFFRSDRRSAMRALLGLEEDRFLIGFAGRYARYKRLGDLIKAFYLVRRESEAATLLALGRSESVDAEKIWRRLWSEVELLALSEHIHFFAAEPFSMPDLYCALDLFVSAAQGEGFGCVLTEAMASEVPVVAVRTGGPGEIARGRSDIQLVPPGDPNAMACAILTTIRESKSKREEARRLRDWITTRYSIEETAIRYSRLFERLVRRAQ